MDNSKEVKENSPSHRLLWGLSILFIFILLFAIFFFLEIISCNDRTMQGKCSDTKPFFCENGKLVERAFICGCSETTIEKGEKCISEHSSNFKKVFLDYFTGENNGVIDFVVDEGFYNYIGSIPRYLGKVGENPVNREDFKLIIINNEMQRDMLLPLVIEIKNRANINDNQAKIAISLVQSIDYGSSEKKTKFFGEDIDYLRYPYEVLYEKEGSCGEKSNLLAFLLKELGYGVAIFYFSDEQHEAVGIKCPFYKDFEDTGYCFIETTGVLEGKDYIGATYNYISKPEVIVISEGKSIGGLF
jgi:hypothetical protein